MLLFGTNAPTISYEYSGYLAIAIVAALDSVFGGITSVLKGNFDIKIFASGFFRKCNSINFINMARNKVKCRHISSSNCSICWQNVYKPSNNT